MKIYLVHSTKCNFREELYAPLKASPLNTSHQFTYLLESTDTAPGSTKHIIEESDLIVAEVSYASTGSGIELGWADAFGKPIICFYKRGQPGSKFLSILTDKVFEYEDSTELVIKLSQMIDTYANEQTPA